MRKLLCKYLPKWALRRVFPWIRPGFIGHDATFLLDDAGTRIMNNLGRPRHDFCRLADRSKSIGADTLYLFSINERDGYPSVNPFKHGHWFGPVDEDVMEDWDRKFIDAARRGLSSVIWLMPDDSPGVYRALRENPEGLAEFTRKIYKRFRWAVTGWCIALEPEEYKHVFPSIQAAARALKAEGADYIGCHGVTGSTWGTMSTPECNVHFHQYGWDKSPAYIESETRHIAGRIGSRKLVAAEYNRSSNNPEQGRAAIRGGAIATGNGR